MGPPRLGIDRVFAVRGFGTVVTGTLLGAGLTVGDNVEVVPSGLKARIRGLQSHGVSRDRVEPGVRCAVNLQGVEVGDLSRGQVITRPGLLSPTGAADVELWWLPSSPEAEGNVSIEFLSGTSERRARLAPIGATGFTPGEKSFARLHIEGAPVPLLPGDRFIARGFARTDGAGGTIGGGVVLDIAPPHRRRSDPALLRELSALTERDPHTDAYARIRRAGLGGVDAVALGVETGMSGDPLEAVLASLQADGLVLRAGSRTLVSTEAVARLESTLLAALDAFHEAEPLRPGMSRGALRGQLPGNVQPQTGDLVLSRLEAAGRIDIDGDLARRTGFAPTLDPAARKTTLQILEEAGRAGLDPPSPRDWAERLGVTLEHFRDLVAHLERDGDLVRAPGDIWFATGPVNELRERVVAYLEEHGEIDTATYKALTGTSRRTTVPLMELLDELHVTRRRGDVRILRAGR